MARVFTYIVFGALMLFYAWIYAYIVLAWTHNIFDAIVAIP